MANKTDIDFLVFCIIYIELSKKPTLNSTKLFDFYELSTPSYGLLYLKVTYNTAFYLSA